MSKNNDLETGLFDITFFIGYPELEAEKYFIKKGWKSIDCYHDYRALFVNEKINKSIIAYLELCENDGVMKIIHIEVCNGIYNDITDIIII